MKKKIIIPATKNNPGTTARMFSLTEIDLHEFSDFILANKEIIIEKSIKLIFLVSKEKIIFYFNKPIFNDDIFYQSGLDLYYYYTCYIGESISSPYHEIIMAIQFENETWHLVNEKTNSKLVKDNNLNNVKEFVETQELQLA